MMKNKKLIVIFLIFLTLGIGTLASAALTVSLTKTNSAPKTSAMVVSLEWSYDAVPADSANDVEISADGNYIAAAYKDDALIFGKASNTPIWTKTIAEDVNKISYSADGMYLLLVHSDSDVYLFNRTSTDKMWLASNAPWAPLHIDISADGSYCAVAAEGEYAYYSYDKSYSSSNKAELWRRITNSELLKDIAICGNGSYICEANMDDVTYIVNSTNSADITNLGGQLEMDVVTYDYSLDGRYIALGSSRGYVHLVDAWAGSETWTYATDPVFHVEISADGNYIVASTSTNKTHYFNIASNQPVWNYTTPNLTPHDIEISGDGSYVIIGCGSTENPSMGYLHYVDNTGACIWNGLSSNITAVDICLGGTYFVAGGDEIWLYSYKSDDDGGKKDDDDDDDDEFAIPFGSTYLIFTTFGIISLVSIIAYRNKHNK